MVLEESSAVIIEIDSSSTLEDLHYALQDILNFENDHMHEFYSRKKAQEPVEGRVSKLIDEVVVSRSNPFHGKNKY